MPRPQLKICGLREQQNVLELAALNPDWMGFIFYASSPRYYYDTKDEVDFQSIPGSIKKVGVFVNASPEYISDTARQFKLDAIQLHGEESPEECEKLKKEGFIVIKSFGIDENFDASVTDDFTSGTDYFLLDTKHILRGGSGKAFDWNLLDKMLFKRPFLLSGGISPEMGHALQNFHHPDYFGIDINSRFEVSPGLKDVKKVQQFLKEWKGLEKVH